MLKPFKCLFLAIALMLAFSACGQCAPVRYRRISINEYRDKMKAGWIGQIVGVSWGAPTEFRFKGKMIPDGEMPGWDDDMVNNAFGQDDLYVEMTFLRSLEQYGLGVSQRQAGLDFAASGYRLWHANAAGRGNLRSGIAPPDSGHPKFNMHADDIDYQIEADFSGLVAPGLPNTAITLGEKFGRLMNYGDGVYGGQFVGGMYAAAFFETDPVKIVQAGLKCIPPGSQYTETIHDVLRWHKAYPNDWRRTWSLIQTKYDRTRKYRRFSCGRGIADSFNIDAKLNGAYIAIGLLYGEGDLDRTIIIACQCGQDSDCNPSNAGGVLFTTVGYSKLPGAFKRKLDEKNVFSYTAYNFPRLIAVTEKIARQAVVRAGGKIVKDKKGDEYFVIPIRDPRPGKLEQCWKPGPVANSRFTAEEMKTIPSGGDK